jgi:CheY-like chemotaxis protein
MDADNRFRILVADDDEAMREYICFALERAGYITAGAKDGKECMSQFEVFRPHVLITDLIMPEAEGIETIRKVISGNPECVIIAMSGAMNSGTYLSMARLLGAKTVLQKPFDRTVVVDAVKQHLEQAGKSAY